MDLNKGIDEQVSNRVDAYRGNPQQLMQMYQQNKELVDLLALQKLKSEKDAAKRQIEMQMQQQPGTVKQQREQELMQMTKDDLAKQTQGVLQRKQQQQQANLQRAAKSGLGAIAPRRPAPVPTQTPKPMMAGGGIVAFQPGGSVGGMGGLEGTITAVDLANLTPEKLAELRETNPERYRAIRNALAKQQRESASDYGIYDGGRTDTDAVAQSKPQRPSLVSRGLDALRIGSSQSLVPGSRALPSEQGPAPLGPETFAPPVERQGPEDFAFGIGADASPRGTTSLPPTKPAAVAPKVATTIPAPATKTEAETTAVDDAMAAVNTQIAGLPAISGGGMGGAEAALMRGVGIGEDVLGRGEKAAKFAEMQARLREFDETTYDPEEERRDQLSAFLIGTANTTNFGSTMAGGAAAALNLKNRQKNARRRRMLDEFALSKEGITVDTELGKAALSLGNQMFADFNANQRAAMSAAATLGAAKLRATVDMANLEFNRDKEANDQKFKYDELDIRKLENETRAAYNNELSIARRNEAILRGMASGEKTITDIQEAAAERFNLAELQGAVAIAGDDAEAREEATRAFNMANAEATAYAAQILDQLGVLDRMGDLENMFLELNGVDAMPGVNPDDITDVQPKR